MKKITLIPGDIVIGQLRANLQLFMWRNYNVEPNEELSVPLLQEVVYWMCEEVIARKVKWMEVEPARDQYLHTVARLVRGFDPEFGDVVSADLDASILSVTRSAIERQINQLDIKPYDIWSIRRDMRYRDIFIKYDGDYRIEEYNRLVEEGVIVE